MDLVEDFAEPGVPFAAACRALGVSRATVYRSTCAAPPPTAHGPAASPRRLADDERQAIVDVMHSAEFVDQSPMEVFATLLGRGIYLASIRTIYRVLAALGETKERRNQRRPHAYAAPILTATAPSEVWTWDITKLATLQKGVFLHAYVIIDLFSRYVVGWMVAVKECKHLATQLFAETVARHGVEPGLKVHSDRGAAMKSDTLAQLLSTLGIDQSFSRPRVSNDNPFQESHFKTMKYQPDYPGRFGSVDHARAWLQEFFRWHNNDHHHSGLALFTPAEVFFERVPAVHAVRQEALDAAFILNPARFPNGAPKAALPPTEVHINPLEALAIVARCAPFATTKINAAPLDDTASDLRSEKAPHATASTPRHDALAAAIAFPS
jgi:transposase InsO family protein